MSLEVVYGAAHQRQLRQLARNSVKIAAKLDLRVSAKKVLSATASCYLGAVERSESGGKDGECKISGRVVTRVIYIDEFDAFNSEERTDNFTEKLVFKNHSSVISVSPAAIVLETSVADNSSGTSIDVDSIVEIAVMGLVSKEIKYATGFNCGAEAKLEKVMFTTFSKMVEERFAADERIELDKSCSGVLGVDVAAYIRDIDCNENRVSIKGCVCVNAITVKNNETQMISNSQHEFDFHKTITVQGIGIDDTVIGNIAVGGVVIKADSKDKPELAVEVDLLFSGAAVSGREIEHAADILSFDNHLGLTPANIENIVCIPQNNVVVDIESNITMPAKAPYISKILAVSGSHINSVNIMPADGKTTIEGVIAASVVYECEEKQIHTHAVQVPFNTVVKVEGVSAGHNIQVAVQPINCHIKARRGKELLVDARLGISIAGMTVRTAQITGDIVLGEAKARDDSAIMIYIVQGKETLWDVAKRINVASVDIIKQNPQVASGVRSGDKIFIYRQNVISF